MVGLGDRYRIERELGQGGMATVYLATDLRHHREVALKVLRPELSAVLGSERFLNEVRITARLDHPHIVTLIDSGETDGLLWYVLPYIRGESLRQLLQRERQLSMDQALAIARQIAGALDYAHKQGVVHRDIKPENILLHEGEAMLADFGIALAVKEAGGNRLTETGLSLGTPQYMSPEQATGDRVLDARSDVYSLAAVVYEMLAGEPPVTGPTVQAVIAKLMTERPTRLRVVRDSVPEGVDTAVAKALSKVPADRFASVAAFASALEVPATESRPARKRTGLGAAWIVGVAVTALVLWLARRPDRPTVRPSDAVPRTQVTFTGNADLPALSPDGKRVAYAERVCDTGQRCATSLVIQDLGGAGTLRPYEGFGGIYEIAWSPDGRYLIVDGTSPAGVYGDHLIPVLGGADPRLLGGTGSEFFAGSDSTLTEIERPDGSLQLVAFATEGGVAGDTVRVARAGYRFQNARVSPDGRRIFALAHPAPDLSVFALLLTREGVATDSLVAARQTSPMDRIDGELDRLRDVLDWSPDGSGIVFLVADTLNPGLTLVVERGVDRRGRFTGESRVLLPATQIGAASISAGGMAYTSGPVERVLTAITRPDARSTRLELRNLASSTGELDAMLSPAGDRVHVSRGQPGSAGTIQRQSLMDFASGSETQVAAMPGQLENLSWSVDGTRLVVLTTDQGKGTLVEVDPATGRTRVSGSIPAGPWADFDVTRGGRVSWVLQRALDTLMIQSGDGLIRAVTLGHDANALRMSPYADEALGWSWTPPLDDTLNIFHVDLSTGRSRTLVQRIWEGVAGMHWISRTTALLVMRETTYTSALYTLDVTTSAFTRLTTLPFRGQLFASFSNDGRRMVVRSEEPHQDVWVAPIFGAAR